MRQNGERRHLVIGYLALGRVRIRVELALDSQASLCGGCRDQLEDHCIAGERLPTPVTADPGKEAMLNLVPFARAWRKWQTVISTPISSANCCSSHFHKRTREPLLPPPSALISSRLAVGYCSCPTSVHQRRMLSTAKAAVSWSMPTFTQPALRPRS